ncbi:Winged helix-like DNA-binding domain superfamily [Sesbania bispinosa]|nr:Winged helix-like DNA-binding domain superfamily [Sesbania bispinosa]
MEDQREQRVMKKLRDSILFRLATSNPSVSINSTHVSFIEHRLRSQFKSFHTPTHPPYAFMIKRAIVKLNEEGGSTQEAISEFIRREYEDLPLAHVRILDIHLRKLCLVGDLVCTENGRWFKHQVKQNNTNLGHILSCRSSREALPS